MLVLEFDMPQKVAYWVLLTEIFRRCPYQACHIIRRGVRNFLLLKLYFNMLDA